MMKTVPMRQLIDSFRREPRSAPNDILVKFCNFAELVLFQQLPSPGLPPGILTFEMIPMKKVVYNKIFELSNCKLVRINTQTYRLT
jgi:hypothetical protein